MIRGGAIGDFVLTLPVLRSLRERFPQAKLDVLGYPKIACLASLGGWVDEIRSIEARPLAVFFAKNGDLDAGLQAYFGSCDIIISYLFDPDGIFQANVARCTAAQFIVGPHRPKDEQNIPAAEVLLKPLERLAIYEAQPRPHLPLAVEAKPAAAPGEIWLAVHPGSGSERKNWPESHWKGLLETLRQDPTLRLLMVGGEAEGQRLDRLAQVWPADRLEIARNWPLPDLAKRLAGCTAFLGHDSGITHLAAAVDLPGVVMWGDSCEAVWRPPSPRMSILRDPRGLLRLPIQAVAGELKALLARAERSYSA